MRKKSKKVSEHGSISDKIDRLAQLQQGLNTLSSKHLGDQVTMTELPYINMYEEDENLIVEVYLPTFKKTDIEVKFQGGNTLVIIAKRFATKSQQQKRHYHIRETRTNYIRRIVLPTGVDTSHKSATFKNGTLILTIPYNPPNNKTVSLDVL